MKKILLLAFFAAVIVGGLVFYYNSSSSTPFIPTSTETTATPTASPTIPEKTITTSEVRSPDGSMKLTMKKTRSDTSTIYSLVVSGSETPSVEIYAKTLTAGEISMPLNSWAPDNKHLFIIENDGAEDNYLIFKATGKAFANGESYIDFRSHYSEKMNEHALKDVTGWDAPDLLHVRTNGPAYWFELGSNAFYRLVQR